MFPTEKDIPIAYTFRVSYTKSGNDGIVACRPLDTEQVV